MDSSTSSWWILRYSGLTLNTQWMPFFSGTNYESPELPGVGQWSFLGAPPDKYVVACRIRQLQTEHTFLRWSNLYQFCATFKFLTVSRRIRVTRVISWIRITSGESSRLSSGGVVDLVRNAVSGACHLGMRLHGINFVDCSTWTLSSYISGVT